MYTTIDEFVMANLRSYGGRNLVSVESASLDLADLGKKADSDSDGSDAASADSTEGADADKKGEEGPDADVVGAPKLTQDQQDELCAWMRTTLGDKRVSAVRTTDRLSESPAIITGHESAALRRMMKMVDQVLFTF
jgi:TNF receptor-associated protein 1